MATSRIFVGIFAQLFHEVRATSEGHDRPLDAPIGRLSERESQRALDVSRLIANFIRLPQRVRDSVPKGPLISNSDCVKLLSSDRRNLFHNG